MSDNSKVYKAEHIKLRRISGPYVYVDLRGKQYRADKLRSTVQVRTTSRLDDNTRQRRHTPHWHTVKESHLSNAVLSFAKTADAEFARAAACSIPTPNTFGFIAEKRPTLWQRVKAFITGR